MTPAPFPSGTSGTGDHPEVAEISALTEGLLSPDRTTEVQAHLAVCVLCADVRSSLEEIRDALGTLPGPVRMPAEVAGRIDAALSAETLLDATAPGAAPSHVAGPVSRETEAPSITNESEDEDVHRRTRALGATTAAGSTRQDAAVPVSRETTLPAFVGTATPGADRPTGRASGPTGPGRRKSRDRHRRWRGLTLAAVGAIGVLGVGGAVLQNVVFSGGSTTAGTTADTGAQSGNEDRVLARHVQTLLAEKSSSATPVPELNTKQSPAAPTDTPTGSPLEGSGAVVPSCVLAGIEQVRDTDGGSRNEPPLLVDEDAPYQDGTGFLVVFPHPESSGPEQVDAYLVDPSCVGEEGTPGKVLAEHTYPAEPG